MATERDSWRSSQNLKKSSSAKRLELSESSSGDFDALVDLIDKESRSQGAVYQCLFSRISCVPARERTQRPGRVNYMGSAVPDCTKAAVRGQDQVYNPA